MTPQRWSQRPASIKVAALSNKVQLLAKWMGRRVTEVVVTVDSGSILTDMQQFLRNLFDGRGLRVLPRAPRAFHLPPRRSGQARRPLPCPLANRMQAVAEEVETGAETRTGTKEAAAEVVAVKVVAMRNDFLLY